MLIDMDRVYMVGRDNEYYEVAGVFLPRDRSGVASLHATLLDGVRAVKF
jgi:hypothetical protein